jgi:DNA-binding MarR family transcriptional regulator
MNANSLKRKIYLEFLISQRLLRQKKYDYITPKDEQLLMIVALAYAKETRLSVIDLLENRDVNSHSAVHKRIQKLRQLNMIEYERTEDRRRYQVNPTEDLLRYFDQLGNSMKAIGKMYLKPK